MTELQLLNSIENELISLLNWHKEEKLQAEIFLRKEGSKPHLEYINNYEDGSISALKDAIDVVRRQYYQHLHDIV